ncbi:MAG: globin domain-containing protein [Pseudomonadota bacterium]
MTPEQAKRVQASFAKLFARADPVADAFYQRLFARDPSLRALFKGDMREQGRKLMAMLRMLTRAGEDLYAILPAIENLAFQHVRFHVTAKDYDTFGEALLETLERELGADGSPETLAAWRQAYIEIAGFMKEAAADVVR